jgi:biopolymer transport protein ExbB
MPRPPTLLLVLLGLLLTLFAGTSALASSLADAAERARQDLQEAVEELSGVRERVAGERIPLAREISGLEEQVAAKRRELEELRRQHVDGDRVLAEMRQRQERQRETLRYVANLFDDYLEAFETRLHIAELAGYREALRAVRERPGDRLDADAFHARFDLVERAAERLEGSLGGRLFPGEALQAEGHLVDGTFAQVGPIAVFASGATGPAGPVVRQSGSLRPAIAPLDSRLQADIRTLIEIGDGFLPIDPTLGLATRRQEVRGNLWEHLRDGGPVMIPILALALIAFGVALFKWREIQRMPQLPTEALQKVLSPLNAGRREEARQAAASLPGPAGEMLFDAVQHVEEGRDLVEEVMYERMLRIQPRLDRLMPIIALTAATAPLLGLLGTVTGMIQTFHLITLFGTGDAQTLSGGISEALVTTQFGLIVAVPALITHALLSRKSKGILNNMEQTSLGFLNGLALERSRCDA